MAKRPDQNQSLTFKEPAALAQRIRDGYQLFGYCGDDDLVPLTSLAEAISEGSQAWVLMSATDATWNIRCRVA
jgi:hypothetical protein